jgi:hypothetical protein
MENSSANTCQKKLLTALNFLITTAYFLKLNFYKLTFKEPHRVFVDHEMPLTYKQIVQANQGDLYNNNSIFYNWNLFGFITKPDRARTNNQGIRDQNQTDPVSIGIKSKINGGIFLNI